MIRFVDLTGRLLRDIDGNVDKETRCFAFYDTQRGDFLNFGQQTVWTSKDAFISDFKVTVPVMYELKRLKGLMPDEFWK